jgi:chitin-binding protein
MLRINKMRLSKFLLAIAALSASSGAMAHGYIQSPESRDYLCQLGKNMNCGAAHNEPQSVGEGPDGFPQSGPKDGQLPAGGSSRWTELNEQTADRWHKVAMKPGKNDFTWFFTAAHPIKDIKYYITKEGWNPNKVLARDSLDLTPFCVIPSMPRPTTNTITHSCNVPQRTGYHVIYALWDVTDTAATFHKTIDVDFGQGNGNGSQGGETTQSEWSKSIGTLVPLEDLLPGSTVRVRVFDTHGERTERELTLTIDTEEAGKKTNWAYAVASMINKTSDLRAGNRTNNGEIAPVYGTNTIFTTSDSGLTSVVITPVPAAAQNTAGSFKVEGLQKTYEFTEGKIIPITITVHTENIQHLKGEIFNSNNAGSGTFEVGSEPTTFTLDIGKTLGASQALGKYTLVVTATDINGKKLQQTYEFELKKAGQASGNSGKYDYVYPDGIKKYKAGTIVLQPENNKLYQCKPLPYAAWCANDSAHYRPGTGWNWQDAWIEK